MIHSDQEPFCPNNDKPSGSDESWLDSLDSIAARQESPLAAASQRNFDRSPQHEIRYEQVNLLVRAPYERCSSMLRPYERSAPDLSQRLTDFATALPCAIWRKHSHMRTATIQGALATIWYEISEGDIRPGGTLRQDSFAHELLQEFTADDLQNNPKLLAYQNTLKARDCRAVISAAMAMYSMSEATSLAGNTHEQSVLNFQVDKRKV